MAWLLTPLAIMLAPFLVFAARSLRMWQLGRRRKRRFIEAHFYAKQEWRR